MTGNGNRCLVSGSGYGSDVSDVGVSHAAPTPPRRSAIASAPTGAQVAPQNYNINFTTESTINVNLHTHYIRNYVLDNKLKITIIDLNNTLNDKNKITFYVDI